MRSYSYVLFLICITMAFIACEPEAEINENDIIGLWEVVYAERNGKPTELVEGALFEIRPDSTMTTDLTGVEQDGAFDYVDGTLHHHSAEPLSYHMMELSRDSMTMRVDIRGLKFMLDMVRQEAEE